MCYITVTTKISSHLKHTHVNAETGTFPQVLSGLFT